MNCLMPLNLKSRKIVIGCIVAAILLTLASRIAVARYLANDSPGDGVLYAQLARNILEHHVYSVDDQPPFEPTLIRLPGYPLFLAGVYAVFGPGNNNAVRIVQGVIDTFSCILIALIAWNWDPKEQRKRISAAAAFVLAALCPFMVIYVGTMLTETMTVFLACYMTLTATYALKSPRRSIAAFWWISTGLIGGLCVTFRPDAGLFLGGIGLTLVFVYLSGGAGERASGFLPRLVQAFLGGALMSIAFAAVLLPWAARNERLFHVFQPLAPAHAEMPGEFVPLGYSKWLSTWIDDARYIDPMLWSLNEKPIKLDDIPDRAFDSAEEKARIAALLDRYNHPIPQASPTVDSTAESGTAAGQSADNTSANGKKADNSADSKDESVDNSTDQSDESSDEEADEEDSDTEDEADGPPPLVAMTPDIDAEFARLAGERIAHSRFRYYVSLPAKRAMALWFDTHSQYYPFDGELFPLSDLDHTTYQHLWLPLFTFLTWAYTILGLLGAYFLYRSGERRWVLLAFLITIPRVAFFATIENPEPRYVIELFAFTAILGGIAIATFMSRSYEADSISPDSEPLPEV